MEVTLYSLLAFPSGSITIKCDSQANLLQDSSPVGEAIDINALGPIQRKECRARTCRVCCSLNNGCLGNSCLNRLREAYVNIIFVDYQFALDRDVENRIWDKHHMIIERYRKTLTQVSYLSALKFHFMAGVYGKYLVPGSKREETAS
jgi:hypothetical protein